MKRIPPTLRVAYIRTQWLALPLALLALMGIPYTLKVSHDRSVETNKVLAHQAEATRQREIDRKVARRSTCGLFLVMLAGLRESAERDLAKAERDTAEQMRNIQSGRFDELLASAGFTREQAIANAQADLERERTLTKAQLHRFRALDCPVFVENGSIHRPLPE